MRTVEGVTKRHSQRRNPVEPLESRFLMAADAVIEWNDVLLDAIRVQRTAPPYAARNMAIVHTAVFDAVNSIEQDYQPYLVGRKGPKGASVEAAAAAAAHRTLASLYPTLQGTFDAALASSLARVPDGAAENKGVALGRSVAERVLDARSDDGADDTVAYTPGSEPADWQPTPPAFAPALLPQWPGVAPFAMTSGSQFRPPAPPDITSAEFAAAFDEVKSLGGVTSTQRTADETQIAFFWADGAGTATPPGHWNEIAQDLAAGAGNSLAENARLFALLNVALADAGIAAWDAKYAYDYCRPVTAVGNAAGDGNDLTEADPAWTPLIATPPFPSYTSGHSTFSAAGAAILADFFGTDSVSFATSSDGLPGVQRSFTSLWAAAEEAGMSRIYGGIHWSFDNTEGLACGRSIGELVSGSLLQPAGDKAKPSKGDKSVAPVVAATLSSSTLDAAKRESVRELTLK